MVRDFQNADRGFGRLQGPEGIKTKGIDGAYKTKLNQITRRRS